MGAKPKWDWAKDTLPFTSCDPGRPQPAIFKLQQVDDDEFELLKPFQYTRGDGTVMTVDGQWLGRTDLASIPTYLGWFARRHGRYTPAALLHDQLIPERKPTRPPPPVQLPPIEADLEFRQALRASEVALVKSWVLWTGVTLGTRMLRLGLLRAAAMVVWFAAALAGTWLLVYGLLEETGGGRWRRWSRRCRSPSCGAGSGRPGWWPATRSGRCWPGRCPGCWSIRSTGRSSGWPSWSASGCR